MRVSDPMLFRLNQERLVQARNRTVQAQEEAYSGLRVNRPSDDPQASALARDASNRIARADSSMRAVDAAIASLQLADDSLGEVGNIVSRAHELAIAAANGTLGSAERAAQAREIEALREQVIALGNTQFSGHYIFAGFQDDTPPFDGAGAYTGDNSVAEIEVLPGIRVDKGIAGGDVFGATAGVDIIQTLQDLVDALDANDLPGIQATLNPLDQIVSQVAEGRSQLGANINLAETAFSIAEKVKHNNQDYRSTLVESDPLVAYSELALANQALASAVKIASQLPLPGLVDIL